MNAQLRDRGISVSRYSRRRSRKLSDPASTIETIVLPTGDAASPPFIGDAIHIRSLGVAVTPALASHVTEAVARQTNGSGVLLIVGHNLHSVYVYHSDTNFREFYHRANLILIDGWPILTLLNRELAQSGRPRLNSLHRIGSTDWIEDSFALPGVERVCVIGASTESNLRFTERIEGPNLKVLGIPADPWNARTIDSVASRVRDFDPQITIVGMGMPLQESVAAALIDRGVEGVVAIVGGAIDQLSGQQSLAPRWIGRFGVEWLWRLANAPRRLAHRYLVEPFQLLSVIVKRNARSS